MTISLMALPYTLGGKMDKPESMASQTYNCMAESFEFSAVKVSYSFHILKLLSVYWCPALSIAFIKSIKIRSFD